MATEVIIKLIIMVKVGSLCSLCFGPINKEGWLKS